MDKLKKSFDSEDYASGAVPQSARRNPVTMGLLWVTMCTGFANIMVGFQWHKQGFSLAQVIIASLVSVALVMAYTIPASYIGCRSGLTWANMSKRVFGRWGSYFASFNLMWVNVGWYSLNAMFCGESLRGLFRFPWSMTAIGAVFAVVMAVNNFFGFAGVANFARWLAAPVLIAWVGYTFVKASMLCPASALWQVPVHAQTMTLALTQVSTLIIGFCCWGNEPDYWRFGKSSWWLCFWPILGSVLVGGLLFPISGWMLAHATGVSEYAQAALLMNNLAFGGVSLLAAFVLFVVYFAGNDANLYGSINALQNICGAKRRPIVVALTLASVVTVCLLAGMKNKFEAVASMSSIFIPSVTVIILAEWFFLRRLSHPQFDYFVLDSVENVPSLRWPAAIALVSGCLVGVATSGVIPQLAFLNVGICAVQAWITCFIVYLILRVFESWKADNSSSDQVNFGYK